MNKDLKDRQAQPATRTAPPAPGALPPAPGKKTVESKPERRCPKCQGGTYDVVDVDEGRGNAEKENDVAGVTYFTRQCKECKTRYKVETQAEGVTPEVMVERQKAQAHAVRPGIRCPNPTCRSTRSEVSRTDPGEDSTTRYRKCIDCGTRFKTTEGK